MQRLAMERHAMTRSVGGVADERMLERCEVHPDLVRAARLEPTRKQRAGREAFAHLVMRHRGLARRDDRHRRALDWMATDRRVDAAAPHQHAVRKSQVFAPYCSRLQLPHQIGLRERSLGDREQAARVLVEPMHDAGAGDCGKLWRMVQQRVGERAVPIAATGMDHQPRGFVDDDERIVFVDDRERQGLRYERVPARIRQRRDDDALAAIDLLFRRRRPARDGNAAGIDPRSDAAARVLGDQPRQRLIEPQPGKLVGKRELSLLRWRCNDRGII